MMMVVLMMVLYFKLYTWNISDVRAVMWLLG